MLDTIPRNWVIPPQQRAASVGPARLAGASPWLPRVRRSLAPWTGNLLRRAAPTHRARALTRAPRSFPSLPRPPAEFSRGRDQLLQALDEILNRAVSASPAVAEPRSVVLCDVEGCLSYDSRTYDHATFDKIRQVNQAATPENAVPHLTVCTGRQAAFVEAICAVLDVGFPAIFEGGCGIFFPLENQVDRQAWHPLIVSAERTDGVDALGKVLARVAAETKVLPECKDRLATFVPLDGADPESIRRHFSEALAAEDVAAEVTRSATSIDISVAGVTKGSAVRWLLDTVRERYGWHLSLANLVGVGDSPNDLSFLDVVGYSIAPANAEIEVRNRVDLASPYTDARAVAHALVEVMRFNLGEGDATPARSGL